MIRVSLIVTGLIIAAALPASAQTPPFGPPPGGANLRGMASQFFPAPMQGGRGRVLACPTGQPDQMRCAAATADHTCASAGWRAAQHFALQTDRGQVFLADLLCANIGS